MKSNAELFGRKSVIFPIFRNWKKIGDFPGTTKGRKPAYIYIFFFRFFAGLALCSVGRAEAPALNTNPEPSAPFC